MAKFKETEQLMFADVAASSESRKLASVSDQLLNLENTRAAARIVGDES